jgi:diaminopimelate epimerase
VAERRPGDLHSRRVNFEKWHALGNDYVIIESEALGELTLTPGRIRAICAPHTGIGSDGILLLSSPPPGTDAVAHLRIFNPDGSESGLSGNGAREAIMYLRAHGRADDELTITTAAGPVRARIADDRTCTMDIGMMRTASEDFPDGPPDGRVELEAGGHRWPVQHVAVGNPQCAIAVEQLDALAALDLAAVGPALEHHPAFPNRTNVSWYTALAPGQIRARIFERGVGETAASGTGATGAAVAFVLAGGTSPVTVELDGGELTVEVSDDLRVHLTGWAVPVYAGRLAVAFLKELHETE